MTLLGRQKDSIRLVNATVKAENKPSIANEWLE